MVVTGDLNAELDAVPDGQGRARVVAAVNQVDDARAALASTGAYVIPAAVVCQRLQVNHAQWARFAAHWEDLRPDKYAAASGTCRMRRYGRFVLARDGAPRLLPHAAFRQPTNTNRLFPDAVRAFDPLTAAFVADPVLDALLPLLSELAAGIEDAPQWSVHVHPFRVMGSTDSRGDATPEGRHQDGVTLVSSLLVARRNAAGGQSSVFDPDGREVLTTTLSEPGTLLVGDDRRTWHSVSPIRPVDMDAPAFRDVLVVTLSAG
ncbi:MAG TPA: 2OG-Fe dioxygenase family protein [Pseudonocardiaceae bacterium]|nr:2OG-Fe dioxygenase family protein [Pseudonocardiaceae bacterium]